MSGTRIASISGLRGIVGDGLDPAAVVEFAAAYASGCAPGPVVVGHDGRASAPVFLHAVVAGVAAVGNHAVVAGPASTPTIGVLVRDLGASGGIQISASHNPPEYNGLKFFQPRGMVLGAEAGRAMLDRLARRDLNWSRWDGLGRISHIDPHAVFEGHVAKVLDLVDAPRIASLGFSVALDSCHGGGSAMAASLLRDRLGCDLLHLGALPDGRYDHPPEPTEANLRSLSRIAAARGAAVTFVQDPDADRLAILDETGRYIGEELTLALAARHRLSQRRGPVVANLSTSRAIDDIAAEFACPVFRSPVGEIHVVERMIAEGAVLGGEGNGGVIDPRVGFVRDSFVAMAMVLDLMAQSGERLSTLVDRLPKYAMVKDKFPLAVGGQRPIAEVWDRIARAHPDAKLDRCDGLRLDWPDGWAHVRASNTEPIVRVIAEAAHADRARDLARQVGRFVTSEAEGEA